MAEMKAPNTVTVTTGENIVSDHLISLDELAPCNHEEPGTRTFVRARQASSECRRADVLVITAIILPVLQ